MNGPIHLVVPVENGHRGFELNSFGFSKHNQTYTDHSGNVYFTDNFVLSVDFDPTWNKDIRTAANTIETFVTKYSAEGQYQWTRTFGRSALYESWSSSPSIYGDHQGNIYIAGKFSETADFDPGPQTDLRTSAGLSDIFITKLSSDGEYLWTITFGSAEYEGSFGAIVRTDGLGIVYVTTSFSGTVDLDPGPGTSQLSSLGAQDVFLAKYSPDGTYLWARALDSGGGNDYPLTLTVSNDNSVILSAVISYSTYFYKMDPSGNQQWNGVIPDYYYYSVVDIDSGSDGSSYIFGKFTGDKDFDPGPGEDILSASDYDFFLTKLAGDGSYQWTRTISTLGYMSLPSSVVVDDSGVTLSGRFDDWADFDPGAGLAPATARGDTDIFIARLDINGNFLWFHQFGSADIVSTMVARESAISVRTDITGNLCITGHFYGQVDFDPGPNSALLTSLGNTDLFRSCYDTAGALISAWQIAGAGAGAKWGSSVVTDNQGNVYVLGQFEGLVDFNPGSGGADRKQSEYPYTAFLTKYGRTGNYLWKKFLPGSPWNKV